MDYAAKMEQVLAEMQTLFTELQHAQVPKAMPVEKITNLSTDTAMVNFIKLAIFCYIGKHSKTLAFS